MKRSRALTVKYTLDRLAAVVALVVLSPLLLVVGLLVRLDSPGPALFRQERAGLGGRRFLVWKFRTMVTGAEERSRGRFVQEQDPLVTRPGRVLRKTAIDELPQLLNVLRGEMSIVGPRPTLPYQVERYDEHQGRRLWMKPGLTGWAQVNGRNSLTWPERIEYDVWYVDHWSLALDLRIVVMTVFVLVTGKGATSSVGTDRIARLDG